MLVGSDLSEVNLSGANLREANRAVVNLSGANLREANLTGAYLNATIFVDVDLSSGVSP
jgi:uncharacterized protein YjbI with pentapeptide repeats